ncbi:gamma-glutamyl-gamma-aminobutyrate hydrolase family protein [Kosmotoga sp. DU53]|uniref:glutamine amidotransferase-related protein n=1 Tax=Kosmotoga sp. DU53 TaxID=1310160 RepID=UPI0007C4846F|nr:gamma-glutamyl-gamma-aminobutyrate hydrolase family protein [Kosmotoga sp. DU53]
MKVFLVVSLLLLSISIFALNKPIALLLNDGDYLNTTSLIEKALKDLKVDYKLYRTFLGEFPEKGSYSGIICSGGSDMSAFFNNDGSAKETVKLITESNVPVLGICMGHQLIGKIYGASLIYLEERGWIEVKELKDNVLFTGLPEVFNVWENHMYTLNKVPEDFELLAIGESGSIQVIKHREKPIYGVQFHPEKGDNKKFNHGFMVLLNFITLVEYYDSKSY